MNTNVPPRVKIQANTQPKRIVRGILFGLLQGILTHVLLLLLCGIVAMQTTDPVAIAPYLGMAISPIAAFSGALRCAGVIGERGLLCGLGMGILYPLGLWMLSLSLCPTSENGKKQLLFAAITFCCAVLGGYLGTHRKQKNKKHGQPKLPQRPKRR